MAVFHAVERGVWRRGLIVLSLLLVAVVMYSISGGPFRIPTEAPARSDFGSSPGAGGLDVPTDEAAVLSQSRAQVTVEPVQGNFFDEYRLERDRSRSMQVEQLRSLLESGVAAASERETIAELVALLERTEQELQAEGLLRARGLTEALVVLGDQGAIVVVTDPISQAEAGSIGNMVAQVTGVPLERITISDGVRLP